MDTNKDGEISINEYAVAYGTYGFDISLEHCRSASDHIALLEESCGENESSNRSSNESSGKASKRGKGDKKMRNNASKPFD